MWEPPGRAASIRSFKLSCPIALTDGVMIQKMASLAEADGMEGMHLMHVGTVAVFQQAERAPILT